LASKLLQCLLFVIHAILYRLLDSEPGRSRSVKLATPRNIKLRHLISHGNDQLRTQNYHRDCDRHLRPPARIRLNRTAKNSVLGRLFVQFLFKADSFRLCENRQVMTEVAV
jgi:hypothetical protein